MEVTVIRMRCFEDVLHQTGWGLYNKFVLFFSVLCAFCSAVAVTASTFALPVALRDIALTKNEVIWINAIFPLGMGVGVVSFGILADIISRKFVLSFSLLIIFIGSFACGFCYEFGMFVIVTFFLGIGASANFLFTKINLSEILPMKQRGYYLVLLDMCWVFGYIFSTCINWMLRCRASTDYNEHYTSWRMLFGFGTILSIFCICFHGMLQPSPRILLATSRKQEAYLVLKYIFSLNNSDHSDNYKVPPNELDDLIKDIEVEGEYLNTCKDQCSLVKFKFWKITKVILRCKTIILLFVINIIKSSLFSGYTMTNIWLAKSLYINVTNCTGSALQFLHLNDEKTLFLKTSESVSAILFRDLIFIALSGFVALFLYSYVVDKFGRRLPLSIALISCGIASANFIFIKDFQYRYALAVIYMTGFAISNAAIDIITIENLPTCIRSTGLGLSLLLPYFEAFNYRAFFFAECTIYYYIIGAFSVAVGVVGYFLPDRKRRPMLE